ncbi:MAG: SH3 domain-containing protein [Pseudomonadales bacterium]|nr:SH3 domain-containing protein [Pseudomonadales bacterium]NRA14617.1 SH3 domain-containing protein [Oceanospirillaceae bacterium]
MVQFIKIKCNMRSALLPLRKILYLWLFHGLLLNNIATASQLYAIEVQPVNIYQEPSVDAKVLHSLYKADHIQVLQLQGKWAEVKFRDTDQDIVGWVEKTKLALELAEPSTAVASAVEENPQKVDFFVENQFFAKSVNSDLHCVKSTDKKSIKGCVLDIDLEVKGPSSSALVEVSCKAEFELNFSDSLSRQLWEQKNIRTPLKQGKGAARLQLAVLPMLEQSVSSINVLSYQCRLEKIL